MTVNESGHRGNVCPGGSPLEDSLMTNPQIPVLDIQKKNYSKPDETRKFDKGQIDLITINGVTFGRATFEPGWKWSTCVKPIAKTETCLASHLMVMESGRLHVAMDDGSDVEFGPGDVAFVPPGHDAWVVGHETVVALDITGLKDYAKKKK
jgi:ethanolamine utilization protein EutQ (cupin superfamily)